MAPPDLAATALVSEQSGRGVSGAAGWRSAAAGCVRGLAAAGLLLFGAPPVSAASNKVRISNLSDVAFGTVANLSVDAVRNQSVCVYADTNTNGYSITATGTGPGGSFSLASGTKLMGYEVQWNLSPGQSSGTQLTPNVPLTGQVSTATHQTCNNGPANSASLIVVVRSAALSSATAGTYNGTLTLVVGAE